MTKKNPPATDQKKPPTFLAYHVPDRENAAWTRIGAAWTHGDGGGFTIALDLVPVAGGRVVLRRYEQKEEAA